MCFVLVMVIKICSREFLLPLCLVFYGDKKLLHLQTPTERFYRRTCSTFYTSSLNEYIVFMLHLISSSMWNNNDWYYFFSFISINNSQKQNGWSNWCPWLSKKINIISAISFRFIENHFREIRNKIVFQTMCTGTLACNWWNLPFLFFIFYNGNLFNWNEMWTNCHHANEIKLPC